MRNINGKTQHYDSIFSSLYLNLFFYLKPQEKKDCWKTREFFISNPNLLIIVDSAPEFSYARDSFK